MPDICENISGVWMDATLSELDKAQQLIAQFRSAIDFFIEKLWGEIRIRCVGQESFGLIKSKVEGSWGITKLEEADVVLEELCVLIRTQEGCYEEKIEELGAELKALKAQNARLKAEIQDNLREAEELDRENDALRKSVSRKGSVHATRRLDFGDLQEANNRIIELQAQLRLARQEGEAASRETLFHKEPPTPQPGQAVSKMAATELVKSVQALVPTFGGEQSPSLQTEVHKFVDACRLVAKSVPNEKVQDLMEILKQRLYGDAYQLTRLRSFTSVEDFLGLIKATYLRTRTLDSVMRELYEACQRSDEDVRQFARRLQSLASTAETILKDAYKGAADSVMMQEICKKLKATFTSGLRDPMLRGRMLASAATNLDGLLEEALVAQATLWRGRTLQ